MSINPRKIAQLITEDPLLFNEAAQCPQCGSTNFYQGLTKVDCPDCGYNGGVPKQQKEEAAGPGVSPTGITPKTTTPQPTQAQPSAPAPATAKGPKNRPNTSPVVPAPSKLSPAIIYLHGLVCDDPSCGLRDNSRYGGPTQQGGTCPECGNGSMVPHYKRIDVDHCVEGAARGLAGDIIWAGIGGPQPARVTSCPPTAANNRYARRSAFHTNAGGPHRTWADGKYRRLPDFYDVTYIPGQGLRSKGQFSTTRKFTKILTFNHKNVAKIQYI